MMNYRQCYDRSIADPASFGPNRPPPWLGTGLRAAFSQTSPTAATAGSPMARLNSCYLALDHQIEQGRGEHGADLRLAGDRRAAGLHLPRAARRSGAPGRLCAPLGWARATA
jgi:hypothetical protein